mmetsp:Transcript_22335/g.25405  ORF Transcript_22335/g.25405 Transcript_22335/m.25405 type:complete len:457 (+) Transcript_22335:63-1433(+)
MATPTTALQYEETAVPTLKVMRLQSPDLGQPSAGSLGNQCLLGYSLALPDSFGVIHVGETFTAYLGAINVSQSLMVRRLTVTAQLQTPSHRWALPSSLNQTTGVDVRPGDGVDAIVARQLEESGQHILRVEVGYQTSEGNQKTLRKFYRFNVSHPLSIEDRTIRSGDTSCFVSIGIDNLCNQPMVISSPRFDCTDGLESFRVGRISPTKVNTSKGSRTSATDLFDSCGLLEPNSSFRFLFRVTTTEDKKTGIACGDELGKVVIEWQKTMGEKGKIVSSPVCCPMVHPLGEGDPSSSNNKNLTRIMMGIGGNEFVVHGSGLSVDVAKVAANRAGGGSVSVTNDIDTLLPVTVEPVQPPSSLRLADPEEMNFLVVNHSTRSMDLQLQFRLNHMSGVAVCGKSYKNLGEVAAGGGSVVAPMKLLPLVGGLLRVQGCCVVDLRSGKEIPQPPLCNIFVEQ